MTEALEVSVAWVAWVASEALVVSMVSVASEELEASMAAGELAVESELEEHTVQVLIASTASAANSFVMPTIWDDDATAVVEDTNL